MADKKTYVCVAAIAVKDLFDDKYKATLPKLMKATIEAAVNKSPKLTTKPPADKTEEGFYIAGTLGPLTNPTVGSRVDISAKVSLVLASWPKKSMFAFPNAEASFQGIDAKKIDKEVEELVIKTILEPMMKDDVIKLLEKRAP